MSKTPPSSSLGRREAGDHTEQSIGTVGRQPLMPEDGYDWKKYGQKYIKSIRKIRSYYRCSNKECKAKKRMECLPTDPTSLRIAYERTHDHRPPSDVEQVPSPGSNQYELGNQRFGQPDDPHNV